MGNLVDALHGDRVNRDAARAILAAYEEDDKKDERRNVGGPANACTVAATLTNLEPVVQNCTPVGCKVVPATLPDRFIDFGLRLAQHDWSLNQLLEMIGDKDADSIMQRLKRGDERQVKGEVELICPASRDRNVVYGDAFGVCVPIESHRGDSVRVRGRIGRERVELLVGVDPTGTGLRRVRITVEKIVDNPREANA